jgi:hypothetical protein
MRSALRPLLAAGVIFTAFSAWADDTLPKLPSGGPESLPSLSSSSLNMAAVPDRALSVTCYLGNPNNNQSLGGSLMVNTPEAAGPTCNSLNFACQGRCFGCYADFDLSEDICVDAAGRKFIR